MEELLLLGVYVFNLSIGAICISKKLIALGIFNLGVALFTLVVNFM